MVRQTIPIFLKNSKNIVLGQKYVVRKKPHGELLKTAHAVDREYRVLKSVEDTFLWLWQRDRETQRQRERERVFVSKIVNRIHQFYVKIFM